MSHLQMGMGDAQTEVRRSRIATALSAHWDELAAPTKRENFSIMNMIEAMAHERFNSRDSYEGRLCEAAAHANMSVFDPQRAIVPWGVFADRGLSVDATAAGGNLVGAQVGDALDVLRPFSVLANMGVRTVEPGAENLLVPNVTTGATGQWLADETSELDDSNPVIGVIDSAPKTAGSLIKASFNLVRQARQGEALMRRQLLGAMAETLDRAILQGTGSDGQPTGLLYAPGVWEVLSSVTPSDLRVPGQNLFGSNHASTMEAMVSSQGAQDLKWISGTSVRYQSRLRQGPYWASESLWSDRHTILGWPAFVTSNSPLVHVFLGDWKHCAVAFWGGGLQIEVDPFTSFRSGAVQVRVLMHCDVYFEQPGAFARYIEE